MTEFERQLTEALKRLSVQSGTERRRQSDQVEALHRQIERLDGQVTRLVEYCGTSAGAGPRGLRI